MALTYSSNAICTLFGRGDYSKSAQFPSAVRLVVIVSRSWRTDLPSAQRPLTRYSYQRVLEKSLLQTHRCRYPSYKRIQQHRITAIIHSSGILSVVHQKRLRRFESRNSLLSLLSIPTWIRWPGNKIPVHTVLTQTWSSFSRERQMFPCRNHVYRKPLVVPTMPVFLLQRLWKSH